MLLSSSSASRSPQRDPVRSWPLARVFCTLDTALEAGEGRIRAECSPDRVLTDSVHLFRRRTALLVSRSASRHSARILPSPASRAVSSVQNTRASGQDLTGSLCGERDALELLRSILLSIVEPALTNSCVPLSPAANLNVSKLPRLLLETFAFRSLFIAFFPQAYRT